MRWFVVVVALVASGWVLADGGERHELRFKPQQKEKRYVYRERIRKEGESDLEFRVAMKVRWEQNKQGRLQMGLKTEKVELLYSSDLEEIRRLRDMLGRKEKAAQDRLKQETDPLEKRAAKQVLQELQRRRKIAEAHEKIVKDTIISTIRSRLADELRRSGSKSEETLLVLPFPLGEMGGERVPLRLRLPSKAVAVGDEWSDEVEQDLGNDWSVEITLAYRLAGVKDGKAKVVITLKKLGFTQKGEEKEVKDAKGSATFVLDVAAGRLLSFEWSLSYRLGDGKERTLTARFYEVGQAKEQPEK